MYALAMLALSLARSDGEVYCALVLAAMGATALPSSLSFLANQAKHDSQGAMQVIPYERAALPLCRQCLQSLLVMPSEPASNAFRACY